MFIIEDSEANRFKLSILLNWKCTQSIIVVCSDTHTTVSIDLRPLHGDGDAVEENDDEHDVVKHLVGDDIVAQDPKPDKEMIQ